MPDDPALAHWAEVIEQLRWAAFLLDRDLRLVWASPEIERFLGLPSEEELGYGLHVVEAFARDAWARATTPESAQRVRSALGPFVVTDAKAKGVLAAVPEALQTAMRDVEPRPFTRAVATSFDYVEPNGEPDLPVYRVDILATPLREEDGSLAGILGLGYMSVRPGLVSLLARGDEAMYERMAKLVEPCSREAAILFCDLQGSTELARTLPTAEYFRLIRSLWTEIDSVVARNLGIVGKHAGDGASAFFLADELGSASGAAAAAVRSARAIHDRSEAILGASLEGSGLMRVGIHWGGSLYMGQLVPGGRLDVTALGDAVNECARLEQCSGPRQTLASKPLIERLSPDDAAALGLAPEKVRYRPLEEVGGIPVTTI